MVVMAPPITPEQLAVFPPELRAIVEAIITHYEQQIAELKAEIARLNKTPDNSSLPPSSRHPHAKPPRPDRSSGKKQGGQPGHAKFERVLIPSEDCQKIVPVRPPTCRRCGHRLVGQDQSPLRHQVWELPPIKPIVTEYQLHRLACPSCGETTCAPLPPGVPTGQSGPRLIAFTAILMAYFRQSKRRTAQFLTTLLNQPCCAALAVKHQNIATTALRPSYDALAERLASQGQLGIDESPTKQAKDKAWLWTFVASSFTFFAVRTTRAADILDDLLTDAYAGVVTCDRAKMYWRIGRIQWCWAHLKRDFQALIDSPNGQAKRLGRDLMPWVDKLFRYHRRYRDGTISRPAMKRLMHPVRDGVEALLLRGLFSGNDRIVGMCRELYTHRNRLWVFIEHEHVEPTNNASERALRHAVIWRKLSFGTQSEQGSRFVETMLTTIETCRQQKRDLFSFVTQAVQAHFRQQPSPSLLPGA
jgi:transposase